MSAERDQDPEATVKMPRPLSQEEPALQVDEALEDEDPEKTIVRENWEAAVIRRIAAHVVAVQNEAGEDEGDLACFGWESEGLRRLSRELQRESDLGERGLEGRR